MDQEAERMLEMVVSNFKFLPLVTYFCQPGSTSSNLHTGLKIAETQTIFLFNDEPVQVL